VSQPTSKLREQQPMNGQSGLDGKGFANSLPLSTETTIAAQ